MRSKKDRWRGLRALCAELHEDDGVDPRRTERSESGQVGADRKTRQLCKQTWRALQAVLGGEVADAALRSVEIVGVEPAPDASRLCVIVCVPTDDDATGVWVARLERAGGFLRSSLAQAITRKRVPELAFAVRRDAGRAAHEI